LLRLVLENVAGAGRSGWCSSVEELGEAGQDHRYGFGRLDVFRAVGFAKAEGF
jgi:hypothetical protein